MRVSPLSRTQTTLCFIQLVQVALGVATVWMSRELVTMTVHSGLGAALMASLVSLYWISEPSAAPVEAPESSALRPSWEAA